MSVMLAIGVISLALWVMLTLWLMLSVRRAASVTGTRTRLIEHAAFLAWLLCLFGWAFSFGTAAAMAWCDPSHGGGS